MIKRRRYLRVRPHPEQPVEVQLMGRTAEDSGGWETGAQTFLDVLHCADVSVGGVAIRVAHGFDGCRIDDTIRLVLKLPGRRAFSCKALVRHVRDTDAESIFGVEFVDMKQRHHLQVEAYVADMAACGRGT